MPLYIYTPSREGLTLLGTHEMYIVHVCEENVVTYPTPSRIIVINVDFVCGCICVRDGYNKVNNL